MSNILFINKNKWQVKLKKQGNNSFFGNDFHERIINMNYNINYFLMESIALSENL